MKLKRERMFSNLKDPFWRKIAEGKKKKKRKLNSGLPTGWWCRNVNIRKEERSTFFAWWGQNTGIFIYFFFFSNFVLQKTTGQNVLGGGTVGLFPVKSKQRWCICCRPSAKTTRKIIYSFLKNLPERAKRRRRRRRLLWNFFKERKMILYFLEKRLPHAVLEC